MRTIENQDEKKRREGKSEMATSKNGKKTANNLKPIERVLLTLEGKETDRVPVCSLGAGCTRLTTGISFQQFSTDAHLAADALIAANRLVGDDIIFPFVDLSVEAADFGQKVIYPANTTAHPDYEDLLIKVQDDYERLDVFDPTSSPRMSNYIEMTRLLVQRCGSDYPIVSFVYGPLGVLGMMRGAENLYQDILEYPDKVKIALEIITEVLKKYTKAQCDLGVAGVCVDTLPASLSGVSSPAWEEFEGHFVKALGDLIRESGCLVVNHGCGHAPYFQEVKRCLNPAIVSFAELPAECAGGIELKEMYGQDMILMGYISTDILYYGTPGEVIEESWKQIDQIGTGGRYVLAPGCEYPPNSNLMNARAMVVAAELHTTKQEA